MYIEICVSKIEDEKGDNDDHCDYHENGFDSTSIRIYGMLKEADKYLPLFS